MNGFGLLGSNICLAALCPEGIGIQMMRDTSPEVERLYRSMIMNKSPQERLTMACAMYQDAKAMALAGIAADYGEDLSELERRRLLFVRMYQQDFDAAELEEKLAALERSS